MTDIEMIKELNKQVIYAVLTRGDDAHLQMVLHAKL